MAGDMSFNKDLVVTEELRCRAPDKRGECKQIQEENIVLIGHQLL